MEAKDSSPLSGLSTRRGLFEKSAKGVVGTAALVKSLQASMARAYVEPDSKPPTKETEKEIPIEPVKPKTIDRPNLGAEFDRQAFGDIIKQLEKDKGDRQSRKEAVVNGTVQLLTIQMKENNLAGVKGNGTGLYLGHDRSGCYFLTASHVVTKSAGQEDNWNMEPSTPLFYNPHTGEVGMFTELFVDHLSDTAVCFSPAVSPFGEVSAAEGLQLRFGFREEEEVFGYGYAGSVALAPYVLDKAQGQVQAGEHGRYQPSSLPWLSQSYVKGDWSRPGMSGGPVTDGENRVVGVISNSRLVDKYLEGKGDMKVIGGGILPLSHLYSPFFQTHIKYSKDGELTKPYIAQINPAQRPPTS